MPGRPAEADTKGNEGGRQVRGEVGTAQIRLNGRTGGERIAINCTATNAARLT
jgi:hypothetical protein